MLDERWSDDVEEVGTALRRLLDAEFSKERLREIEHTHEGRDASLEQHLQDFGLEDLEGDADMYARIAYELGRALVPTAHIAMMPVQALLGRSGVALAFTGTVPVGAQFAAVLRDQQVWMEPVDGVAQRTTAGDYLVTQIGSSDQGDYLGDADLADRLERYSALLQAARLVGAAQALLAYGVAYANERQQFGKLIGSYQGVAHRLARASGDIDAAELLVRKAAFTASAAVGGDGAPEPAFAHMVRAKAIQAAREVATQVHQVFGGNGFAMEYDVQLYSRRIRSWALRGVRPGDDLAALGRLVLDPKRRDAMRLLWHYDLGIPLPRWAAEADTRGVTR